MCMKNLGTLERLGPGQKSGVRVTCQDRLGWFWPRHGNREEQWLIPEQPKKKKMFHVVQLEYPFCLTTLTDKWEATYLVIWYESFIY